MLIPTYWAQSCLEIKHRGKDTHIWRFGWSNISQKDAENHAKARCEAALDTLTRTGKIKFFDVRDNYLGLERQLPIKEQVLERFDDGSVLTVNSYGASCLNVPDVLILDIDNEDVLTHLATLSTTKKPAPIQLRWVVLMSVLVCLALGQVINPFLAMALLLPMLVLMMCITDWIDDKRAVAWQVRVVQKVGGFERFVSETLAAFAKTQDMSFRLYATPNGFRVIATNRHYLPNDEMAERCFEALFVDKRYAHLCKIQRCFRSRVTAKPWRMAEKLGVLPTKQFWVDDRYSWQNQLIGLRQAWLKEYHANARQYRACRFVASFGTQQDDGVMAFVALHDRLCQCEHKLPMA